MEVEPGGRVDDSTERELKFSVPGEFELPDLMGFVSGIVAEPSDVVELDAVYHDSADFRLARRGVTLRRRSGEGSPRWTLKLPKHLVADPSPGLLARREIELIDPAVEPPTELVERVRGLLDGGVLSPVVRLVSRRHRIRLVVGGNIIGEIDDDDVTVVIDGEVTTRFREVEIEFTATASDDLIGRLAAAMLDAGAGPADPTPKLVRALGSRLA